MSTFDYAKMRARQEESRARTAAATMGGVPPVVVGEFRGEVGGSGGGVDFSTPGGGSMVDSEEERFLEVEAEQRVSAAKQEKGAVKLLFPLLAGQVGMEEKWPWNVCGGLIGGAGGNRFCTKLITNPAYTHCGIGSHAVHKANLQEGHGYIPNVSDRAKAYLEPSIDASRFPGSFSELLGQSLSYEGWLASFTVLPTREEIEESAEVGHELVAEVMEKSRHIVSFAVTPAAKKPRLTNVVSNILNSKSAKNLASRFDDEGFTDKVEMSFEELEAPRSEDWTDAGAETSTFSPTPGQWNSLVQHVSLLSTRVSSLTEDLEKALAAVATLAELSENRFESVDDQVVHLRGSIGSRPRTLGPNLPGLDLWTNVSKMSDEAAEVRDKGSGVVQPSPYESMTRTLTEAAQKTTQNNARAITTLSATKAEYVGQVKPIEAAIGDVFSDLYEPEGTYNKALMSGLSGSGGSDTTQIRAEVSNLSNQVKELTGANLGGTDTTDPVITSLKADVATLLVDNQTIKASLGGEIVKIENEAFHSAEEVKGWIVDHVGPASGTYEFFFDVTSMLESLQDSGRTSDETMDSQAISHKANHRSVSAARMLNSFQVNVPQVMNKKNNPDPFSLVPNYVKWKSNDGRSGLVENIRKSLLLWQSRTEAILATRFAGKRDVLLLARGLMQKSKSFWTALCNWIDEFYGKLISKTEAQRPGGDSSLAERKEYDATLSSVREEAWRLFWSAVKS
jgi:hypothetical protein